MNISVLGVLITDNLRLWSQLLVNFLIPEVPKLPLSDRRIAAVGLTRMLTRSTIMLQDSNLQSWCAIKVLIIMLMSLMCNVCRPMAFAALSRLFSEPQHLTKNVGNQQDIGLTAIDWEEQSVGYQAAYSRLAASETTPVDPVAYVSDPKEFLRESLAKADPRIRELIHASGIAAEQTFL